jgi:hypothetical protein
MRREVFTSSPPQGDYILNPTGFTWHVRRATGTGSVLSLSVTDRTRKDALATMLSLAEADRADAWENDGGGSFRLVKRFRSSPCAPTL